MTYFSEVINGIVNRVIVAEQDFIDLLPNPSDWIQTSYNTFRGENLREGGTPLRMNFGDVGFTYDEENDRFIPPKPFDSWILDEQIADWVAPIPKPDTDNTSYVWKEDTQEWIDDSEP